jgi:hypothetical protein
MKSLKFMFFVAVFAKRTTFSRAAPPAGLIEGMAEVYLAFKRLISSSENYI